MLKRSGENNKKQLVFGVLTAVKCRILSNVSPLDYSRHVRLLATCNEGGKEKRTPDTFVEPAASGS